MKTDLIVKLLNLSQPVKPGFFLRTVMYAHNMGVESLAESMGRPLESVRSILYHDTGFSKRTCAELEHVFDVPAEFWRQVDQDYRDNKPLFSQKKPHQLTKPKRDPQTKLPDDSVLQGHLDDGMLPDAVAGLYGATASSVYIRIKDGRLRYEYKKNRARGYKTAKTRQRQLDQEMKQTKKWKRINGKAHQETDR